MIIRTSKNTIYNIKENDVTSETSYLTRRKFIQTAALSSVVLATPVKASVFDLFKSKDSKPVTSLKSLSYKKNTLYNTTEKLTNEFNATHYNNFYEFSLDKEGPARLAKNFVTKPWQIEVEGEAENTGAYNLEDILKKQQLEERIYRLRCVEAWSMVIPWVGFPLSKLLNQFKPNSKAKYVEFTTLYDPKQMPGQNSGVFGFSSIKWPYVEGLTIAEAMNPLTFIATGLYGKSLPPQNGAPLRLVVPWKYGFKSIKSIVKIRFTSTQPKNSWAVQIPSEYGFYANVNPAVDHPRWSQAKERRIVDSSLFSVKRIKTQPFNGYADQVASLYSGMDLRRNF